VRVTLDIDELAPGGEGVGRTEGRAAFVPFTAPGDRIVAEVPGGAGVAHATLVEVLSPGPLRVEAPCRHFGVAGPGAADERGCGGCEWLHVAYEGQLAAKAHGLAETLRRIGRLEPGSYHAPPILGSPRPLRYRSRAKFHFDRATSRLVFFRRRSHVSVQLRECHLLTAELDALREATGPALAAARLEPREVTLEWSEEEGRGSALLQLAAVTPAARQRAEELVATLPALPGVVLAAEGAAPVLVGRPVLRHARRPPGTPTLSPTVPLPGGGGNTQRSRPDVFQQANRFANALLVDAALALLRPEGEDVLELFCGSGNFTGPLAARARSVHAVEVQGPALELARQDLEGANVRFFAGDALALARAFGRETGAGARRFGAALLDPPREGARGIGPALRDLRVPRAVYVSCDPATFARDLRACVEAGFTVEAVQAVDMFPQTHHVEAVGLLTLRK
jgi:23S rRNA (uracil1939-C5)-methyltransferase